MMPFVREAPKDAVSVQPLSSGKAAFENFMIHAFREDRPGD